MGEDEGDYRPRANDHLVEPMYSGLGVGGDEEAREFLHEVDPEADEPGVFLRFLRSARRLMGRGGAVRPADGDPDDRADAGDPDGSTPGRDR